MERAKGFRGLGVLSCGGRGCRSRGSSEFAALWFLPLRDGVEWEESLLRVGASCFAVY